jgi:acetyl-CoA C-acetyltransferase
MRDAEGKMDGKLIGKALGYVPRPGEREGKVFIFPHLFAEIMECYLKVHRCANRTTRTITMPLPFKGRWSA